MNSPSWMCLYYKSAGNHQDTTREVFVEEAGMHRVRAEVG